MHNLAPSVDRSIERERALRDRIRDIINAVVGDDLTGLLLFGSRARGDARDDSDWDVAVLVRQEADYRDIATRIGLEISRDQMLWECAVQPVVLRPSDMAGAWGLVRNLEAEAVTL
jgi:predicted nucleotidyltransferase